MHLGGKRVAPATLRFLQLIFVLGFVRFTLCLELLAQVSFGLCSIGTSPPSPFLPPLNSARNMIPVHDRSLVASARPSHPSSFSTSRGTTADRCTTEYREHPHAPGSRTRILEAVRYCCGWQNLQSVCGPNGAYLTISELQYHTDNDVLLWMKLNLNTVTYAIFCKRVWGREQAFAMQLVDHSTECP